MKKIIILCVVLLCVFTSCAKSDYITVKSTYIANDGKSDYTFRISKNGLMKAEFFPKGQYEQAQYPPKLLQAELDEADMKKLIDLLDKINQEFNIEFRGDYYSLSSRYFLVNDAIDTWKIEMTCNGKTYIWFDETPNGDENETVLEITNMLTEKSGANIN